MGQKSEHQFSLRCDTCGDNTNVRFGLSNRDEQPVRFACRSCGAPIDIIMGGPQHGITGAPKVQCTAPFDAETNFVDIHLDFSVSFEPYEMGMTPFMRASARVGAAAMNLHAARLNHLNAEIQKSRFFRTILKLYAKEKIIRFKLNIERTFGIKVISDKPQDLNAALYSLIAEMMMAYAYPNQSRDVVEEFQGAISKITKDNKAALDTFVEELVSSGFLKNLQLDALEIYPRMLDAELVMRPALFLDFDEEYAANPIPMRVSAKEFDDCKDLYKDISEIISRQFVLVAGINNLLKRGDHNSFAPKLTANDKNIAPANLNAFANVAFGLKQDYIDASWYDLLDGSTSNRLRNAIAHYKAEYDEITQLLTYYPRQEGLVQEGGEKIYFLEFVRCLLVAYREMHRLHHLIKVLFYYHFLVMKNVA